MNHNRLSKRLSFDQKNTEEIYSTLAKIDGVKSGWKMNVRLSPQLTTKLQKTTLITSSGSSTRIEGSKLSDTEVAQLFQKMRIKKFRTRDEQEVAGYLELLEKIFNSWETLKFSESLILHFHKELLKYSQKDQKHKGAYKFGSNRVEARDAQDNLIGIIFDPTPPHLVTKEMQELTDWFEKAQKSEKHPLLLIANFIFEFLAIHPFQDGNGRTSRVLTNLLLLQNGYEYATLVSHERLVEDNKADYYLALQQSQKTWKSSKEDLLPWLNFFLKMILHQSELAVKILEEENEKQFLSEKQKEVFDYAQTVESFSRLEALEATGIAMRTMNQIIDKLLTMKKIERLGQGRATRYRKI